MGIKLDYYDLYAGSVRSMEYKYLGHLYLKANLQKKKKANLPLRAILLVPTGFLFFKLGYLKTGNHCPNENTDLLTVGIL